MPFCRSVDVVRLAMSQATPMWYCLPRFLGSAYIHACARLRRTLEHVIVNSCLRDSRSGAGAGIGIGCAAAVAGILLVTWLWRRERRKRTKLQQQNNTLDHLPADPPRYEGSAPKTLYAHTNAHEMTSGLPPAELEGTPRNEIEGTERREAP
ncbi:hypothetical protein OPT61_g4881 [Boeremia exigua]|uniref:Uncharacterized protein n=1 Tax=Boeremia exigua TaxID=749465 RepID=A0ACC2ICL3_9PLEO|nr:hypothetical protein OPT61_g4881 [Boeremia exigua]